MFLRKGYSWENVVISLWVKNLEVRKDNYLDDVFKESCDKVVFLRDFILNLGVVSKGLSCL